MLKACLSMVPASTQCLTYRLTHSCNHIYTFFMRFYQLFRLDQLEEERGFVFYIWHLHFFRYNPCTMEKWRYSKRNKTRFFSVYFFLLRFIHSQPWHIGMAKQKWQQHMKQNMLKINEGVSTPRKPKTSILYSNRKRPSWMHSLAGINISKISSEDIGVIAKCWESIT